MREEEANNERDGDNTEDFIVVGLLKVFMRHNNRYGFFIYYYLFFI